MEYLIIRLKCEFSHRKITIIVRKYNSLVHCIFQSPLWKFKEKSTFHSPASTKFFFRINSRIFSASTLVELYVPSDQFHTIERAPGDAPIRATERIERAKEISFDEVDWKRLSLSTFYLLAAWRNRRKLYNRSPGEW